MQFDSHARNMRYKSWPYFKDWEMIFGKDRATGETAEQWQNVADQEAYIPAPPEQCTPTDGDDTLDQDENESVNEGVRHGETSSTIRKCKRKRGDRDKVVAPNVNMVDLMSSFFIDVSSQIGALVSKVGTEKDAKGQRQNLIKELDDFPLSVTDKIIVAKRICSNMNDVDIFYGLDVQQREAMVYIVLNGSYYK